MNYFKMLIILTLSLLVTYLLIAIMYNLKINNTLIIIVSLFSYTLFVLIAMHFFKLCD